MAKRPDPARLPDPAGLLELRNKGTGQKFAVDTRIPEAYHANIIAAFRQGASAESIAKWLTENVTFIGTSAIERWLERQGVTRDGP